MEILEAGQSGAEGAVFTVVVGGRRVELPWVEYATVREGGVLVLEAEASGSGSAAVTWVRTWDQATWQVSLGEEANAPRGKRVKAPEAES
jgi:hypothetical protein